MTVKTVRSCALFVLSLHAACASLDGDASGTSEIAEELRVSDWSAAAYVGSDFQEGCLGGQVATLNGTTYMVHSGTCGDDEYTYNLWWTKLTPSGWTNDIQIPNQQSARKVSLAAFNGYLYMLHSGVANWDDVWMSRFNPTTQQWSPNTKLAYQSAGSTAIAAFNGRLQIVGVNPANSQLWMASMNTAEAFTPAALLPGQFSGSAPSLAVYAGRIYLAHRAASTSAIVYNSFDGAHWGTEQVVPAGFLGNGITGATPAIAAHDGYLHLVHTLYEGGGYIYWTYFDGTTWASEVTIGTLVSWVPPSVTEGGAGLVVVSVYQPVVGVRYVQYLQYQTPLPVIIFQ
jgi:hypothetical protein